MPASDIFILPMHTSFIRCAAAGALALLLLAAGCGGGSEGRGASTFSKSYGGPLHDEARVVLQAEDGGFMLFGTADALAAGSDADDDDGRAAPYDGDFWVQKLDANGNVERTRLIGLRSNTLPGTTWQRARPAPDGGSFVIGTAERTKRISRPSSSTATENETVSSGGDIVVTRLDAAGGTLWSVSHDSGAWLNYDYFSHDSRDPEARDEGEELWPLADGGVLVAGTSRANLEDRLGIGFPCDDAELDALRDEPCAGATGGNRYLDAQSLVLMRLNPDGSLRWVRRFTEEAFDAQALEANATQRRLIVRTLADGGIVLARSTRPRALIVSRLAADGAPLWRRVVAGAYSDGYSNYSQPAPTALVQTDDPVNGRDGNLHDGLRNDGMLIATEKRVIKLAADGALEWNVDIDLEGADEQRNLHSLSGVEQRCDYGRPTRCDVVVVGKTYRRDDLGSALSGFVAFLDASSGDLRAEAYPPRSAAGDNLDALSRVDIDTAGTVRLLGEEGSSLVRFELTGTAEAPVFSDRRTVSVVPAAPDELRSVLRGARQIELRPDGGVLLFANAQLATFDTQMQPLATATLASSEEAEILRTAVQIAPGRFVLAGRRKDGFVILRYDFDANGERVVWQRRIAEDPGGDVRTAAPSGDGGVVLGLSTQAPGDDSRTGLLLKLDADGRFVWQRRLPGPPEVLQRTGSGNFIALNVPFDGSGARVSGISPQGELLWQRSVDLRIGPVGTRAMAVAADGSVLLAAATRRSIELMRLGGDGALVWSHALSPPVGRGGATFSNLQVRAAAAGGFVLAMTERNLFESLGGDDGSFPRGGSNALVMKVDAAGQPLWSRVYGARYGEGVRDLLLRDDGTIVIAGYSDSFGDNTEAWLLKLSPQGLVSEGGCQALLGSIPTALIDITPLAANVIDEAPAASVAPPEPPPTLLAAELVSYAPTDFIAARQCLGDASAGSTTPPEASYRLSVLQVGSVRGVVTSTPAGISCGSGLDICQAAFAANSRVVLRADAARFVAWQGECDPGSGGTQLDCVVTLDRDRTIQVEYGPRPPPTQRIFTLAFAVQGEGFVRTTGGPGGGINCGEGGSAANCSRDVAEGTPVEVTADASPGYVFLGWSGDTADSICPSFGRQTAIRITVDRNLRCGAQFGLVQQRLIALNVAGAGVVRDEPGGAAFNCRQGSSPDDCQQIYLSTETLALRATPDAGQRFVGWGGDCAASGSSPLITLLTAQGQSCSAVFEPIVTGTTLTVQIVNAGTGRMVQSQPAGIDCNAPAGSGCTVLFAPGTTVLLRAFGGGLQLWQGCDDVLDISYCRVTLDRSRSVQVHYAPP